MGPKFHSLVIEHLEAPAGANCVLFNISGLLRDVKAIWFSAKNVVSLYSKEERAHNQRVLSSFWAQNNGHFTSEIKIFLVASEKFLVASEIFLSAVGARGGLSRKFSGPETIKNIKVSDAKKLYFNIFG